MEAAKTIGGRIKFLRKRKGMTQGQFAAKMGITQGNLSLIENNLISASIDMLVRTSDFFDTSCEWLIRGDDYCRQRIVDQDFLSVMTTDGNISDNSDLSSQNFFKRNHLYRLPGFEETGLVLFRMNRENMTPTFNQGDVLVCMPIDNVEILKDATPVMLKLNDEMIIRRLYQNTNGDFLLKSDNERFKDIPVKKSHVNGAWKIQGVIRRINENLSTIDTSRIDGLEATLKLMQAQLNELTAGVDTEKIS